MTILSKRVLLMTALIVAAMSALHVVFVVAYYSAMRSKIVDRTLAQLKDVANANEDIFVGNTILRQDSAVDMLEDELASSQGISSATWRCASVGASLPDAGSHIQDGVLSYTSQVALDDGRHCQLRLEKDLSSVVAENDMKRQIALFAGYAAVLLVAMAAGIVLTMRRYFSTPIAHVFDAIDRLAADDLGFEAPVESHEFGEIIGKLKQVGGEMRAARDACVSRARLAVIGEMSSSVAHDMRTPLSVLKSYVSLPDRSGDPDGEELRKAAERSVRKLLLMATDLVDYAKARKLQREIVSVKALFQNDIVPEVEGDFLAQRVQFTCDVPASLSAHVDRHKIARTISNMLSNASRALEGRAEKTIMLGAKEEPPGCLAIRIGDSGNGIREDVLPHIFDFFYSTEGRKGSGIGLAYCKQVVEGHGGTIDVQSAVGEGTAFTIRIPDCVVEGTAHRAIENNPQIKCDNRRFIIVDDDADIRLRWRRIVQQSGGTVAHEASSLEEVQSREEEIRYDGIDVAMVDYHYVGSKFCGTDVIRYMREKGVPEVHLCTGHYDDEDVRAEALAAGADSVIPKG